MKARDFLLNGIDPECEEHHFYRFFPADYDLEDDIRDCLNVFAGYDLAPHDLLVVRRAVLGRYAFGLASEVNRKLKGKRSRFWLYKDHVLPRVGFAMLAGYGVLLGAGETFDWLGKISCSGGFWPFLFVCVVLSLGLIYLNVRDCLGDSGQVLRRTTAVALRCLIWPIIYTLLSWLLSLSITTGFSWAHAVLCAAAALLLGIVGQYFFQSGGSMAEPL